jgi:acid stress chaperone HdeB
MFQFRIVARRRPLRARAARPPQWVSMLKAARAVFIAATLASASPSHAQTINLANLKCKEFIDLSKETIATLTVWLDGYYTDEEDAAVFEPDKLKSKAEKLTAFCAQNPKMALMTAAENVMAK